MKYIKRTNKSNQGAIRSTVKSWIILSICLIMAASSNLWPMKAAAENISGQTTAALGSSSEDTKTTGELHAFYPSNAVFSKQIQKYIDGVDSLSFAWSRIDSEDPGIVNTMKGKNGNTSFYYPADYIKAIEYAKSKGKSIQLNIYMDADDSNALLPYDDKRAEMIKGIIEQVQAAITEENEIYYDGIVIDFEGLRNTASDKTPLLYEGKQISNYYIQFLKELKLQLSAAGKKLYVAVNPGLYYDGYQYSDILDIADRVILMAHDYEPTERLQKNQVQQYTGYNALEPIHSMAPIEQIRRALNEMRIAASSQSELSKVWLQITFDSAQWQFDVKSADAWLNLDGSAFSRKGRVTPLYQSINDRVHNKDGKGTNITYGYNNELQTPFIQYYNTADKSWNVMLYEDSKSISAKINMAKSYGLGGISLWSLANVPDYTDSKAKKFHLDGWTTVISEMQSYTEIPSDSKKYVKFADAVIEQTVRDKLGKTSGKITVSEVKGIYRLQLQKGVKSLKDLKYLTNLEYLDAQQLGIKDISAISYIKNLRVLYLQRNKITDISALKNLKNLKVLSLNGNQIASISSLASLTNLQELYLRENKIESITSLSKLTNLEVLEIGMNQIKKIDALKNMKKLHNLGLDNNKISEIQALKSLTGLKELYLQRNLISNIKSISYMKKVKLLSLNGNKISDLTPLAKLTSLEKLYLKDNKIVNVAPLKGLSNLKELYLKGNRISNYNSVKKQYLSSGFSCDFTLK